MEFDEELALLLQRAQVVNPQSFALRHRANGLEQMFALRRARFRVHHHIGRNDFSDALLDGIADRAYLLEASGTRDTDRSIHKMAVARGAPPDPPQHHPPPPPPP